MRKISYFERMARIDIKRLTKKEISNSKPHELVAGAYEVISTPNDKKLLQIDTFGRDSRKEKKKVSQSMQFDQDALEWLLELYQKEFKKK